MPKQVEEAEEFPDELLDLDLFLTGPEIQALGANAPPREDKPGRAVGTRADASGGTGNANDAAAIRTEAQARALAEAPALPGRQASAERAAEMGSRGAAAAMAIPGAAEFRAELLEMAPDPNEISDAEALRRSRLSSPPNRFMSGPTGGLDDPRIAGPSRARLPQPEPRRLGAPAQGAPAVRPQAPAARQPGSAMVPMGGMPAPRPSRQGEHSLVATTFRNGLASVGAPAFDPDWLAVRQLPGYLKSQIRSLGRNVLSSLGCTVPIEDVQMISTLTHTPQEVQQLAAAIVRNGDHLRTESMVFGAVACQVQLWRFASHDWTVVQDPAGHYVYGWPENHSIRPSPRLGQAGQNAALGSGQHRLR